MPSCDDVRVYICFASVRAVVLSQPSLECTKPSVSLMCGVGASGYFSSDSFPLVCKVEPLGGDNELALWPNSKAKNLA